MSRIAFEGMWFRGADCGAHAGEEGEGAFGGGGSGERWHFVSGVWLGEWSVFGRWAVSGDLIYIQDTREMRTKKSGVCS